MDFNGLKNVTPIFQTLLNNAKSGIPKKIQVFIGILALIWLLPIVLDIVFVVLGVFYDYKPDMILKFLPRLEQCCVFNGYYWFIYGFRWRWCT